MLRKTVKRTFGSVLAALLTTMSVGAPQVFAERINYYTDDMSGYAAGLNESGAPVENAVPNNGWTQNYTPKGSIGASSWSGTVDCAYVNENSQMPYGKVFQNLPNKNLSMYYKTSGVDSRAYYISLGNTIGNDSTRTYYMRWTTYLPITESTPSPNHNIMLQFWDSNGLKINSGLIYNDGSWKTGLRYGGSGAFTYGATSLEAGKFYTCVMKITTDYNFSTTPTKMYLKAYEYGETEPEDYDVQIESRIDGINITTLCPMTYGIPQSYLQAYTDFQIDGYTGDDIAIADRVFTYASKLNPVFENIRTQEDLDSAIALGDCNGDASDGITVEWALNTTDTDVLKVENGKLKFVARPTDRDYTAAVTAIVKNGNAVTRKSFPITVKGPEGVFYSPITARKDGNTVIFSVNVTNNTGEDILTPCLLAGIYNDEQRLCLFGCSQSDEKITANSSRTLTAEISGASETEAQTVKAFLWEDLRSIQPLPVEKYSKNISEISQ